MPFFDLLRACRLMLDFPTLYSDCSCLALSDWMWYNLPFNGSCRNPHGTRGSPGGRECSFSDLSTLEAKPTWCTVHLFTVSFSTRTALVSLTISLARLSNECNERTVRTSCRKVAAKRRYSTDVFVSYRRRSLKMWNVLTDTGEHNSNEKRIEGFIYNTNTTIGSLSIEVVRGSCRLDQLGLGVTVSELPET